MNIQVEALSLTEFMAYGSFINLLEPEGERIGNAPVEFFRDMTDCNLGAKAAALSCCRLSPRQFLIVEAEYHSFTEEVTIPLDGDVVIFVGAATPAEIPEEKLRAFKVPRGTAVVLKAGVWHGAPFPLNNRMVHALVLLPERTYANDCTVKQLKSAVAVNII
jgi:ureidoglycolate lyase